MRVLIVDDEPSVRALISHVLEDAGYQVVAVQSVADAKPFLEAEDLSAVVLDLWLPNGHGRQVVDQLLKCRNDVLVVILTGHPEEAPTGFPISSVLGKPPDHLELVAAVDRAGDASEAIRSMRASTQRLREIQRPQL